MILKKNKQGLLKIAKKKLPPCAVKMVKKGTTIEKKSC